DTPTCAAMRRNDSRPFFCSASMMLLSIPSIRGARVTAPRRTRLESLRNARRFYHAASHCVNRPSVELRHHVLHLGVVLERVQREVLAVARLLVAAVRHLGDERNVVVDPDRPELELPRRVQ